jgi:hypothetical protein
LNQPGPPLAPPNRDSTPPYSELETEGKDENTSGTIQKKIGQIKEVFGK